MEHYPDSYLSMGLTAERVAQHYGISREEADQFALASHQKALAAQAAGKFDERDRAGSGDLHRAGREVQAREDRDRIQGGRRPARGYFARSAGQAQAGVPRQGHGDGGQLLADLGWRGRGGGDVRGARRRRLGLQPLARFVAYAYAGCLPEEMGIGPVYAIPKALKLAGLTLDQIDLIELNEAFAAQALAVIKTLGIDLAKVNVNGGAIALGHPLGCTGAKLTASLLQEMKRRNAKYGMVTMCVGGGMGAAGIFENLELRGGQPMATIQISRLTAKRRQGRQLSHRRARAARRIHTGGSLRRAPADRQNRDRVHHQRSHAGGGAKSRPRTSPSRRACCARPASWG